jgi:hypothetical protein
MVSGLHLGHLRNFRLKLCLPARVGQFTAPRVTQADIVAAGGVAGEIGVLFRACSEALLPC